MYIGPHQLAPAATWMSTSKSSFVHTSTEPVPATLPYPTHIIVSEPSISYIPTHLTPISAFLESLSVSWTPVSHK